MANIRAYHTVLGMNQPTFNLLREVAAQKQGYDPSTMYPKLPIPEVEQSETKPYDQIMRAHNPNVLAKRIQYDQGGSLAKAIGKCISHMDSTQPHMRAHLKHFNSEDFSDSFPTLAGGSLAAHADNWMMMEPMDDDMNSDFVTPKINEKRDYMWLSNHGGRIGSPNQYRFANINRGSNPMPEKNYQC